MSMARAKDHQRELEEIAKQRQALQQAQAALEVRDKAAREAIARQSNDVLMAAFSKGRYGIVSKADAARLAKAIAALGIDASLAKLTA
jgi:1-deoxy-D-xylulose 5-phosphate reductoisomerase